MKNAVNTIILCSLLFVAGNVKAQSSQDFSEKLLGSWSGTGTLFGQTATFTMKWENELNSKFMKLIFENRFADNSGTERIMNAQAYYQLEQNKGYWFDSRGMMLPLSLEINDGSMTVLWGDENSERGKTIYTVTDKEHIVVQDFVFKDNSYLPFGEADYERLKE